MDDVDFRDVASGLFVFIPGLPSRSRKVEPPWHRLIERLRDDLGPAWRVEVFDHSLTATSREDLDQVTRRLAAQMRDWAGDLSTDIDKPDAIILSGHSFGGILARAAYLLDSPAPDTSGQSWTRLVERIVLLGSPNTGYRPNAPSTPRRWRLAYALATPFFDFTIEKVQSGGYWITDLRLRWLEAYRAMTHRPRVVQVLGTDDDLVTRDDILDQQFMPEAKVYEIPDANHAGLVDVDSARDPDRRYKQLKAAILGRPDEQPDEQRIPLSEPTCFILHGIRASALGTWVADLGADFIAEAGGNGVEIVSPDTGYFSAIEFALPGTRRRKVHEFLKLYGDAYAARDPNRFVFAGHSNGTYMMAQALDRVPAMRFRKIYLAGTVLPRRYGWQRLFAQQQVGSRVGGVWTAGSVRVDRATTDVPVGLLCSWLRGLGMTDVGTAGVDGFEHVSVVDVDQRRKFRGGHGSALHERKQLEDVARYLADAENTTGTAERSSSWFERSSRFLGLRPVAWTILIGMLSLLRLGFVKLGQAKGPRVGYGAAFSTAAGVWVLLRTV